MILLIAFFGILVICFGVLSLFMTSSKIQKVIDRRILAILRTGTHTSSGEPIEAQLLKLDPAGKFKWLNVLLQNHNISKKLKAKIIQADIKTTPAMILSASRCSSILSRFNSQLGQRSATFRLDCSRSREPVDSNCSTLRFQKQSI